MASSVPESKAECGQAIHEEKKPQWSVRQKTAVISISMLWVGEYFTTTFHDIRASNRISRVSNSTLFYWWTAELHDS